MIHWLRRNPTTFTGHQNKLKQKNVYLLNEAAEKDRASIHVRSACSVVRYVSLAEKYEQNKWLFAENETHGKLSLKQTEHDS